MERVAVVERRREMKDLARWRKIHRQLRGVDPFNPANRDSNGRKIYDYVIPTGTMTVDEVAEHINGLLFSKGLATRERARRGGVIFEVQA